MEPSLIICLLALLIFSLLLQRPTQNLKIEVIIPEVIAAPSPKEDCIVSENDLHVFINQDPRRKIIEKVVLDFASDFFCTGNAGLTKKALTGVGNYAIDKMEKGKSGDDLYCWCRITMRMKDDIYSNQGEGHERSVARDDQSEKENSAQ